MKKIYSNILLLGGLLFNSINTLNAQISFTNANASKIPIPSNSGCPTAVVDWNGDGLDDIIRLHQGRTVYVDVQRTNNTFEMFNFGLINPNASSGWAWGMAVADLDHNGYKDVIAGGSGSGGIKVMKFDNNGQALPIIQLPSSTFFLQNLTMADFNNDGWIDIFACNDVGLSIIYLNDGAGNMILPANDVINFDVTSTDDSGNYGSVWTDFDDDGDFDLYIAKCRQGVTDITDGRRINVMFVNNGDGTYTEQAAQYNLNIHWQSWTASPGDLDNDGDLDFVITNHDAPSSILINDGTGHYSDITSTTGFSLDITPIQSVIEDFDNDGFADIFITGDDARYFKNNGNLTFTLIPNLFNSNNMGSFAIGDLNHDGFIDIFGIYQSLYTNPTNVADVLWSNNRNNNHFITFDLQGTTSNHDAIGTKVKIYGPWGTQVREVRAGESYGTINSAHLHFGLGQITTVDSVFILWPSGSSQTLYNVAADQFINIRENDCISPISLISGSNIVCDGGSTTLSADAANVNYLWSTGATTQSIEVTEIGEYNVTVSSIDNTCSAVSQTIFVTDNPEEPPVITYNQLLTACYGEEIILNGPSNQTAYNWSNGAQTQNITVTQSGIYNLTVPGACFDLVSQNVEVNIIEAINPSITTIFAADIPDSELGIPGAGNLNWYDSPGGNLLATGNPITLDMTGGSTTLYVQAVETFGGGIFPAGKTNFTGASLYSPGANVNAKTSFTVFEPCTLKTVKVYTDRFGTREFQLFDAIGNIITTASVNVNTDTAIVQLNWELMPGDYEIGTNGSVNQAIPGNANGTNPRLRRNNTGTGISFPYVLQDVLSITGNDVSMGAYYYFYDWQVEKFKVECTAGELVAIDVQVTPVSVNEMNRNFYKIYPNPGNGIVNIELMNVDQTFVSVTDLSGRTVLSSIVNNQLNTLDLSTLSKGMYQVNIIQGEKQSAQKLIIQ